MLLGNVFLTTGLNLISSHGICKLPTHLWTCQKHELTICRKRVFRIYRKKLPSSAIHYPITLVGSLSAVKWMHTKFFIKNKAFDYGFYELIHMEVFSNLKIIKISKNFTTGTILTFFTNLQHRLMFIQYCYINILKFLILSSAYLQTAHVAKKLKIFLTKNWREINNH